MQDVAGGIQAFREGVKDLLAGNFSRSEPLFVVGPQGGHSTCRTLEWFEQRYFDGEAEALQEALTCACFLGQTVVAEFLLDRGVEMGIRTGLNGFHWAGSRGHVDTVELLIRRKLPLETKNMYGGTVLGQAVWSAIHEPKPGQLEVIEKLLSAGARVEEAGYPTGNQRVDELLVKHGARKRGKVSDS